MQSYISNVYETIVQIQTPYLRRIGHQNGYIVFQNDDTNFSTFIDEFCQDLKQKYNVNVPILQNNLLKISTSSCHRFLKRMDDGDSASFILDIENYYQFHDEDVDNEDGDEDEENYEKELPRLSKVTLKSLRPLPTSSLFSPNFQ